MRFGVRTSAGRTCASPPCASMARTTATAPPASHTARLREGVVARCSSVRQPCACRVASAGKARIAARAAVARGSTGSTCISASEAMAVQPSCCRREVSECSRMVRSRAPAPPASRTAARAVVSIVSTASAPQPCRATAATEPWASRARTMARAPPASQTRCLYSGECDARNVSAWHASACSCASAGWASMARSTLVAPPLSHAVFCAASVWRMKPVGSVGGDDTALVRFASAPSSALRRARLALDDGSPQYDATRVGLDPEG